MNKDKIHVLDFLMIALGCAFYGYGLVNVNIANNLAEGGVTGVTLIIRYWLHIDPAYTTVLINVPLILIGYRYLGKKSLLYTVPSGDLDPGWSTDLAEPPAEPMSLQEFSKNKKGFRWAKLCFRLTFWF